jgi:hypothetical protein
MTSMATSQGLGGNTGELEIGLSAVIAKAVSGVRAPE